MNANYIELEMKYKLECFKTQLLTNILEKTFNIKLSEIMNDKDFITIYPNVKEKLSPKKKKRFISTKNPLPEKTNEEVSDLIKVSNEQHLKIIEDVHSIEEIVKNHFTDYEKERKFDIIKEIVPKRLYLLQKYGLPNYIHLLHEHNKIYNRLFNSNKKVSKPKKQIIQCFSLIDNRLLGNYSVLNHSLNNDEVEKFVSFIKLSIPIKNKFEEFKKEEFIKNFINYSLCLINLKDFIEIFLCDKSGYGNVIFLQNEKNNENDPFSFYYLEEINKKRRWRMDCRLEELSSEFSECLLNYSIPLFREIYLNIFGDNEFRENFLNYNETTSTELEQLLQNIIISSDPYKLCKLFQSLLIKTPYNPTENDKFNLFTDDKMQQKQFSEMKKKGGKETVLATLKLLFDEAPEKELLYLYQLKQI